jgi:glycosyltransferase involved in cell wall biosynthesis
MIANMQCKVPVVSTYHGSDINNSRIRWISKIAIRLSSINIFVSQKLKSIVDNPHRSIVVPCGVDTNRFYPMDRDKCRDKLGMDKYKTYILFSKEFADKVKNYPLAKVAVERLSLNAELIEFYGYNREQVPMLYNAVDCALLTSFTEGSPQFVKEAIACGCPIVSTDVGDAAEVIDGVENSYISTYEVDDVIAKLYQALRKGHLNQTNLDTKYIDTNVAKTVLEIYTNICSKK